MRTTPDHECRRRALTDLQASLLVEAGAGTGKTSLLAGRVAMLLAAGVDPGSISAITFTELAAAELGQRIRRTVAELLGGQVPAAMRPALPDGLPPASLANLRIASTKLDGLRTATIHGFCQELIRGYAVEADVDPGASVADRNRAEVAFDLVFDAWLRRRLDRTVPGRDAVSALARSDPRGMETILRELARFRLRHRSARPPASDLGGRPDMDLIDAVDEYRRWVDRAPPEKWTLARLGELERLARFYAGSLEATPDFGRLWELAHPDRIAGMRKGSLQILRPRTLSAWRKVAGEADGARLDADSLRHHDRVVEAFGELLGRIGGALVETMSGELDEVLADYAAYKRAAALLDFDDLLEAAAGLIRSNPAVRMELAGRHRHILVDEFQDTDALQCDIIFRLAADDPTEEDWRRIRLRPGALFAVGDPKQAIYQFRGAHVATYEAAKSAFEACSPDNLIRVTTNFRSRRGILSHVNRAFETPMTASGQPGHTDLDWIRVDLPDRASAAKLTVRCSPLAFRSERQEEEAEAVAAACRRLIGSPLTTEDGTKPVVAGDIALLAPTGTDLWRYERALRNAGVPYASHAGKAIFRRQEAQDFVTLARVLADARDTLAFGALLRGPMVGLTDEELLDIAEALPEDGFGGAGFTMLTDPDLVEHDAARAALRTLQRLRSLARSTSPADAMIAALEAMNLRAIVARRDPRAAAAAEANLDRLIERARDYAIRGMRAFAHDLGEDWFIERHEPEGRPDAESASVEIMSVHSAKGLEWPIVIPINACVGIHRRGAHVHCVDDDTLHWMLGDVAPPGLAAAIAAEADSLARERVRLWYVACTRARDLLVLPLVPGTDASTWAGAVDLLIEDLPELTVVAGHSSSQLRANPVINRQDAAIFAAESARIADATKSISWVRPSDRDRRTNFELVAEDSYETGEVSTPVAGGRVRGLLLHKLLEEVIEEGLAEDPRSLSERAAEIVGRIELVGHETIDAVDLHGIAGFVAKALAVPEVAALRPRLRAEVAVNAMTASGDPVAGRCDAVAIDERGRVEVVIDWKSDVSPSAHDLDAHLEQVRLYLASTGAGRAMVVYPSIGLVRSVDRR